MFGSIDLPDTRYSQISVHFSEGKQSGLVGRSAGASNDVSGSFLDDEKESVEDTDRGHIDTKSLADLS